MSNDKKLLEDNKHISTIEVKQDIADTEAEIITLEREKERQQFIVDLKRLLNNREQTNEISKNRPEA